MQESQKVEWKRNWNDEWLKWICGFANTEGGLLFIGKDNKGNVTGLVNSRKLMEDIPNKIRDVLGIMVDVNFHQEMELEYIEIVIEAYPYPVNYKGHYYYRSGSTNQELRGAALDRFLMKKQGLHWDSVPLPGLTKDEFTGIGIFKKLAKRSQRIEEELINESEEILLDKLHLVTGEYYKRAAALLFAEDPERYFTGAYTKIGYFESDSELIYQDEVHGNLFHQVEKVIEILLAKYLKAIISYEGIQRIEKYQIPKEALREGILNAIIHKDYSSGTPIQISVYNNKLMIWNSGELPIGWTKENLMSKHSSKPYNPDIANAFFRTGLIEAWGRGISKMKNACKDSGVPEPEVEIEGGGYWLKFPFRESIGKVTPETAPETAPETTVKTPDKILNLLRENPKLSLQDVAENIGKSLRAVKDASRKLQDEGKLERLGPNKGGYWKVIDE